MQDKRPREREREDEHMTCTHTIQCATMAAWTHDTPCTHTCTKDLYSGTHSMTTTLGPTINQWLKKRDVMNVWMGFCHLEFELSGCNNMNMTALDSDHYTYTVWLTFSSSGHSMSSEWMNERMNDAVTSLKCYNNIILTLVCINYVTNVINFSHSKHCMVHPRFQNCLSTLHYTTLCYAMLHYIRHM